MSERMKPRGRMVVVALLMSIAKRLGLARPMLRMAFRRMFGDDTKAKAFAGYQASERDVFVATFGKSGTNWMMQIAQQIAWLGHAEFEHIHDVVPWPDSPMATPMVDFDPSAHTLPPTGKLVIKTHLETEFVPYDEHSTYLTVLRDPKEVVVSAYYFLGGLFGVLDHVSIDAWHELSLGPGGMADSWARHTASYWAWRDRPNVLVLNYRDVLRDPVGSIDRVAEKMGVELTEAQRDSVVERSSFQYMKDHEAQFAPPTMPFMKQANRPKMIRRGKTGGSEELLDRAQQAETDRVCRAALERLGSDFPYASFFDVVEVDPR